MDERERYEAGMTVRRAVLGDAHVDRSLSRRTSLGQAPNGPSLRRRTAQCVRATIEA